MIGKLHVHFVSVLFNMIEALYVHVHYENVSAMIRLHCKTATWVQNLGIYNLIDTCREVLNLLDTHDKFKSH